jgi:hypothetical protein
MIFYLWVPLDGTGLEKFYHEGCGRTLISVAIPVRYHIFSSESGTLKHFLLSIRGYSVQSNFFSQKIINIFCILIFSL